MKLMSSVSDENLLLSPTSPRKAAEYGAKTKSLTGDTSFGSGELQKRMSKKKIELISEAPEAKNTGKMSKSEFNIDLEKEKATCPEGETATKCYKSKNSEGETTSK